MLISFTKYKIGMVAKTIWWFLVSVGLIVGSAFSEVNDSTFWAIVLYGLSLISLIIFTVFLLATIITFKAEEFNNE